MPAPLSIAPELEPLVEDLATFTRMLPGWRAEEGRFALIAGGDLLGIYDTYNDAVTAGYAARGLDPFLVKRIMTVEMIGHFTRDVRGEWPISATP